MNAITTPPPANPSSSDAEVNASPTKTAAQRIHARGLDRYLTGLGVELEAVEKVATPGETDTFVPVPHHEYFAQIEEQLDRVGIGRTEVFHSLYAGGARYIGLAITDLAEQGSGSEVVVGWFNAHDHSHAATFLLGEQVTVCFNLCLHAEIKVTRRHTKHIRRDLPHLIGDAVERIGERVRAHAQRMDQYRDTPLHERDAEHLLFRLADQKAFPKGLIHKVRDEWREPSQEDWARRWNVNRLYQAVTVQQTPVLVMPRRHRALHGVLDEFVRERSAAPRNIARLGGGRDGSSLDVGF